MAACWAAIFLAGAAAAQPRVVRTEHFSVYYERLTEKPSAQDAARIGQARMAEIAADLGYTPRGRIAIAVYRDRRDFLEQAGVTGRGPIGVVNYPENVIYLDVSGSRLRLSHVVPHEITHVLVMRLLEARHMGKLPRWFNEGLAEYESQAWAPMHEAALAEMVRDGRVVPLRDLDRAFGAGDERVGDAYLQAWSLVRYLAQREGDDVVRRILAALKAQPDFESALAAETGLDLDRLERDWRGATRGRGPRPPAALTWGLAAAYALGGAAALVLVVKLWLTVRRRAGELGEEEPKPSEERWE